MNDFDSLRKEYDAFMKWFKETHPELHEKYCRNISIPLRLGGGVTVNNNYKLSQEEFEMLGKIANSYYNPSE